MKIQQLETKFISVVIDNFSPKLLERKSQDFQLLVKSEKSYKKKLISYDKNK